MMKVEGEIKSLSERTANSAVVWGARKLDAIEQDLDRRFCNALKYGGIGIGSIFTGIMFINPFAPFALGLGRSFYLCIILPH